MVRVRPKIRVGLRGPSATFLRSVSNPSETRVEFQVKAIVCKMENVNAIM